MPIRKMTVGLFAAAALVSAAASLVGCSSHDGGDPAGSTPPIEHAGSIGLDLQVAPGFILNSVSYTITGPLGFAKAGAIDVSGSTKISALIGGLPAGKGFSVTLSANAAGGVGSCSGSASFDIVARKTTPVTVSVTCHEAARSGSVLINGQLNVCPVIDGVSASPAEVAVGGSIVLGVTAHDSDAGPSALSYQWKASAGKLSSDTVASPTFTCTEPGTVTLNVAVSDGDPTASCADTSKLTVECSELCTDFDSITAALGELTADCRGTVDPRDYIIAADGRIAPAFDSCPLDANDPTAQHMLQIRQLLSVQHASDLPNVIQCTAGRFKSLKEKFAARGIDQCPTWSNKKVLNPPTPELIKELSPLLPVLIDEESVTLKEPFVAPPELSALKIKSTYTVTAAPGGNQRCGTPAQCAAACAEVFPGFVTPSTPGAGLPDDVVLVDPDSWWDEEIYDDMADPDPNNMNPAFYHQMGYVLPTPGQKYGALARFNPCNAPGTTGVQGPLVAGGGIVTSTVCQSEKCNYWAGGSASNPSYIKTKLQQWCVDPKDVGTCLSYCGSRNLPAPAP